MTEQEWLSEAARRISISEGIKCTRYLDSRGIPTIGVGYNLQRGDADLLAVGCTNVQGVIDGTASITESQALTLLSGDIQRSVVSARGSLKLFDSLTDARQFVITDLVYNMGFGGWISFGGTRATIDLAQKAKDRNDPLAHNLFLTAGEHLAATAYYTQTGNRAKRNVAMLIQGEWCDANGDGSDIYKET